MSEIDKRFLIVLIFPLTVFTTISLIIYLWFFYQPKYLIDIFTLEHQKKILTKYETSLIPFIKNNNLAYYYNGNFDKKECKALGLRSDESKNQLELYENMDNCISSNPHWSWKQNGFKFQEIKQKENLFNEIRELSTFNYKIDNEEYVIKVRDFDSATSTGEYTNYLKFSIQLEDKKGETSLLTRYYIIEKKVIESNFFETEYLKKIYGNWYDYNEPR